MNTSRLFAGRLARPRRTRRRRAHSTATMSAASFTVKPVMQVRVRPGSSARARRGTLAACPAPLPRRAHLDTAERTSSPRFLHPPLSFPQVTRQFASLGNTFTKKAAAAPAKVDTTVQSTYHRIARRRIARATGRASFSAIDRVIGFWCPPKRPAAPCFQSRENENATARTLLER